ncbi:MAG: hypothetical protein J0L87_13585 [Bacteroidetes bacterium]|nr:hypothetical protein [Bacteroidota bacterium]
MQKHPLNFLNGENIGWVMLNSIANKKESGKSAPKFKRIGMGHYLHAMKVRISNGDFD